MSIAFNAAPFDSNVSKSSNDRKKRNKTIKRDREKVNNMIDIIHNSEENNSNLSDFTPPPKPELNTKYNNIENFQSIDDINKQDTIEDKDFNDNITPENYNTMENSFAKENNDSSTYIDQIIPYYNTMSESNTSKDVLVKKLNYMIHLLEEQKDIKTETVTEELILYSFLGVFIIFIIDSFVKAGKYVR